MNREREHDLILCLDTSTSVCSVALLGRAADDGASSRWATRSERQHEDGREQTRVLLRSIDDMLAEAGAQPTDLTAAIVGAGPGTFTGVRIAVSTARALGLALRIPVLGVSTLGALAAQAASELAGGTASPGALPRVMVPCIDAKRDQVFYACYVRREAASLVWERCRPLAVCARRELAQVTKVETERFGLDAGLDPAIIVVAGDKVAEDVAKAEGLRYLARQVRAAHLLAGQERLLERKDVLGGERLCQWLEDEAEEWRVRAAHAPYYLEAGEVGTPEAVRPIYVRAPDADVHITKMRDPWAPQGDHRNKDTG